jgi:DNA-binding NtrC family response regulator
MQVKLLRALQEKKVRRVGGRESIPIEVRLVSATHRDLQAMIAAGEFREDLYYRIAAGVIEVPPLRQRDDDVLLLAKTFLARLGREHQRTLTLDAEGERKLRAYHWPGNVRELDHVLARAFLLSEGERVDPLHLPDPEVRDAAGAEVRGEWPVMTLRESERRTIEAALRATGGDKTKAAKVLGISRTALYDKLKRFGAQPDGEQVGDDDGVVEE